jgi:hypothetical protein
MYPTITNDERTIAITVFFSMNLLSRVRVPDHNRPDAKDGSVKHVLPP